MSTVLVIRPRGPYGRVLLPSGTKVIECSAEHLPGSSLLDELPGEHLGCIILEDMRAADLDCAVSAALMRGAKGHSCPVVTRWTQLAPDDAR